MENDTQTSGKERRFGRRHLFAGGGAFVRVARHEHEAGRREPVKILDFSIGGVGFFTDRRASMPLDRAITLEIGAAAIEIRVRRTRSVEGSRLTYYGAEFTDPTQGTVEHLAIHVPLQPDLPEFAEVQSGSETMALWTTTLGEEWTVDTVVVDPAARERALHPWPFPASDARPAMAEPSAVVTREGSILRPQTDLRRRPELVRRQLVVKGHGRCNQLGALVGRIVRFELSLVFGPGAVDHSAVERQFSGVDSLFAQIEDHLASRQRHAGQRLVVVRILGFHLGRGRGR